MAKFPEPPGVEELARVAPEQQTLPAGTLLWRVYFRGAPFPTYWDTFRRFGPTGSRFDHQLPPPREQKRGILYAARHGPTSLAEVFQQDRLVDRTAREPWLVGFRTIGPLILLDLMGAWPTRAGASMGMCSGPRPRAQRWSQVIYQAYPGLQGLWYPSSMHGNRPAVALYERAGGALPPAPEFHRPLSDPALLAALRVVAEDLGYDLT